MDNIGNMGIADLKDLEILRYDIARRKTNTFLHICLQNIRQVYYRISQTITYFIIVQLIVHIT